MTPTQITNFNDGLKYYLGSLRIFSDICKAHNISEEFLNAYQVYMDALDKYLVKQTKEEVVDGK
jgi:hypothetical protein